jgi:Pre-PUA-like domain
MFKKFNAPEDVAGRQNVKSSVQRGIKNRIIETFPKIEVVIEDIIPKKAQLTLVKWYIPRKHAVLPGMLGTDALQSGAYIIADIG